MSGCSIFASRHHPPLLSLDVLGRDEANANILKFEVLAFVAALSVVALFSVVHAAVPFAVAHAIPSLSFLAVLAPAPVLVLVPLSPGLSVPSYHVPVVHVLSVHATAAALLNVAPFVLSFGVPSALFVPVPVVEYAAVPSIAAAPSSSAAPLTRVVSDPAAALGDCIATDPEVENLVARLLLVALSPHHMRDLS